MRRLRRWWPSQPGRVRFAVVLLVSSILGWPLSALTLARNEPQTVLGLSWLAISITCLDVLFTSQVKADQDDAG